MVKAKALWFCVLFLAVINLSGCATTHYVKTCPEFEQKISKVKIIGMLPISYESNSTETSALLERAIFSALEDESSYDLKLLNEVNYSKEWNIDIQRVISDSLEIVKEIEREGIWRDSKNKIIDKKFKKDVKAFKALDPELDALLVVKCEQHYGNPFAAGFYLFGAVGGLMAALTSEKDAVIGMHSPADNDTYSTAILVDLDTANILWYNFSLRRTLDMKNEKHAKEMTKDMLYGLINSEK